MMGARTNEWHQSLMQVVQDFISMMKCSQIFIVTKQIACNSMILHIEWSMIFSVLINIYIYNQWQNIMAILKPVFKILPSPSTVLPTHNTGWRNFCFTLFLNIVKKGKGAETKNRSNSNYSHNFCHWLSDKLSVVFYSFLFYIKLKACNYPLRHNFAIVSHNLNSFWMDEKVIWYG